MKARPRTKRGKEREGIRKLLEGGGGGFIDRSGSLCWYSIEIVTPEKFEDIWQFSTEQIEMAKLKADWLFPKSNNFFKFKKRNKIQNCK